MTDMQADFTIASTKAAISDGLRRYAAGNTNLEADLAKFEGFPVPDKGTTLILTTEVAKKWVADNAGKTIEIPEVVIKILKPESYFGEHKPEAMRRLLSAIGDAIALTVAGDPPKTGDYTIDAKPKK